MIKEIEKQNLDWYKSKNVDILSRGNLSLVSPALISSSNNTASVKTKCVWPSSFMSSNSKILSRRVYGRVVS